MYRLVLIVMPSDGRCLCRSRRKCSLWLSASEGKMTSSTIEFYMNSARCFSTIVLGMAHLYASWNQQLHNLLLKAVIGVHQQIVLSLWNAHQRQKNIKESYLTTMKTDCNLWYVQPERVCRVEQVGNLSLSFYFIYVATKITTGKNSICSVFISQLTMLFLSIIKDFLFHPFAKDERIVLHVFFSVSANK